MTSELKSLEEISLDQISREEHKKWAVKYTSQNTNNKTSPSGTSSLGIVPWDASWDACRKAMEERQASDKPNTYNVSKDDSSQTGIQCKQKPLAEIKAELNPYASDSDQYYYWDEGFDEGIKYSESRQAKKDAATKVFTDAVSDHVKELYKEGSADFDSVEKALNNYEESLK